MKEVLINYDLCVKKIEKISEGYSTNKWLVITKENKYVLKEENMEYEQFSYIINIIENLNSYTPEIIHTINDEAYVFNNNKYYYLTRYYDHEKLTKNNVNVRSVGNFLGIIHCVLEKLSIDSKYCSIDCNDNLIILDKYLEDSLKKKYKQHIEMLKYKIKIVKEFNFEIINYDNLNYQNIHGDFYLDNILFKDNKYYVIDFDRSCKFYKEYEILRAMFMVCLDETKKDTLKKMKEFIEGYKQNNYIVSAKDAYNLYLIIQANSLSCMNCSSHDNNKKMKFAKKRFKNLKFLYENKDEIIKIIDGKEVE